MVDALDVAWREFESKIGTVVPETVDDEYIDGVTNGHKCICGQPLGNEVCEICGATVRCMNCHLETHEIPITGDIYG